MSADGHGVWGLGTLPRVVAAGLVLAGLLAAVAVIWAAERTADLEADRRTRGAAANAVPVVAATLRSTLSDVEALANSPGRQVGIERSEEVGVPADVAVEVRDRAQAALVESGVAVAATYSTPSPPGSVAERRAAVTGLHVVPVRLAPTLNRLRPADGGIAVSGPTEVVASDGGRAPDGAASYTVPLSSQLATGWSVTVWTPGGSAPLSAWLLAGLCVLVGLGAGVFVVRRAAEVAATADALDRLRSQSAVLAELAGVAQRSLDLADVLPAVTTQLVDSLGLRGLTLTDASRDDPRALFRHGEPPTPTTGGLPESVRAGESVTLPLARGSRTVARLHVLAGRDLDAEDLVTLDAAGQVLTSAITNAETFAQQREALQRLRTVDELKTVFLATASHELRTPVGVISGFAELLSRHADDLDHDQVRDYASRIDTTAQQLATLVENLLDFSRMERGVDPHGDQVVLDLGGTVRRVLDEHRDLGANHQVVPNLAPDVPVLGSEHAVERVLTNLVGNAAKYSPAGTTIRVLVRTEGDRAVLHVDDEGPGVAPEDRDRVFSRFYRGSGDAVVNTRGAGLGLAIVHEFVTSMGGVASVSESGSGGARFSVSFPLAAPAPTPQPGGTDVLT